MPHYIRFSPIIIAHIFANVNTIYNFPPKYFRPPPPIVNLIYLSYRAPRGIFMHNRHKYIYALYIYSPYIAISHTSPHIAYSYILYYTLVGGVTAHTGARIIIGDGVHTFIGINQELQSEARSSVLPKNGNGIYYQRPRTARPAHPLKRRGRARAPRQTRENAPQRARGRRAYQRHAYTRQRALKSLK